MFKMISRKNLLKKIKKILIFFKRKKNKLYFNLPNYIYASLKSIKGYTYRNFKN